MTRRTTRIGTECLDPQRVLGVFGVPGQIARAEEDTDMAVAIIFTDEQWADVEGLGIDSSEGIFDIIDNARRVDLDGWPKSATIARLHKEITRLHAVDLVTDEEILAGETSAARQARIDGVIVPGCTVRFLGGDQLRWTVLARLNDGRFRLRSVDARKSLRIADPDLLTVVDY